jgi:hypothetical protein
MAKYEFTTAAGNRIVEKCLTLNKEKCFGCIPYEYVDQYLRDEDYRSEYAVTKFVEWLKVNSKSSSSAVKVLGLVACGMADELVRDKSFIGNVESFHAAMTHRFGVHESNVVKEG